MALFRHYAGTDFARHPLTVSPAQAGAVLIGGPRLGGGYHSPPSCLQSRNLHAGRSNLRLLSEEVEFTLLSCSLLLTKGRKAAVVPEKQFRGRKCRTRRIESQIFSIFEIVLSGRLVTSGSGLEMGRGLALYPHSVSPVAVLPVFMRVAIRNSPATCPTLDPGSGWRARAARSRGGPGLAAAFVYPVCVAGDSTSYRMGPTFFGVHSCHSYLLL